MKCLLRIDSSTSSSWGLDVSAKVGMPPFRLMVVDEKVRLGGSRRLGSAATLCRRRAQRVHRDAMVECDREEDRLGLRLDQRAETFQCEEEIESSCTFLHHHDRQKSWNRRKLRKCLL